jgi:hypothetical protein
MFFADLWSTLHLYIPRSKTWVNPGGVQQIGRFPAYRFWPAKVRTVPLVRFTNMRKWKRDWRTRLFEAGTDTCRVVTKVNERSKSRWTFVSTFTVCLARGCVVEKHRLSDANRYGNLLKLLAWKVDIFSPVLRNLMSRFSPQHLSISTLPTRIWPILGGFHILIPCLTSFSSTYAWFFRISPQLTFPSNWCIPRD